MQGAAIFNSSASAFGCKDYSQVDRQQMISISTNGNYTSWPPIELQERRGLVAPFRVEEAFDLLIRSVCQTENVLSNPQLLKEILDLVEHLNGNVLCDSITINRRTIVILRDCYSHLLKRWHLGEDFDDAFTYIFETISGLLMKISNYLSDSNIAVLKEFVFHEGVLDELTHCLESLSSDSTRLHDYQMKGIDHLVRTIQRLQRISTENKTEHLFIAISKCICAPSFAEVLIQSLDQDNNDAGQRFILNTCVDYVCSHSTNVEHRQCLNDIRQSLLPLFSQWFMRHSSLFRSWNYRIIINFRQICFLLTLPVQLNRHANLENDVFVCYCQILDSFTNVLYSVAQSDHKTNTKLVQSLIGTIMSNVCIMSLSKQLGKYIQSKHIVSLILQIANNEDDEVQLNILKILAVIVTEQDIKNTVYSSAIANLLLKSLHRTAEDLNQSLRCYDVLQCLKDLIRCEPIADELVKQNGIYLIVRCATDLRFNALQTQQPALEILFELALHSDAHCQLKSHASTLEPLLSSCHGGVSRITENILWKLGKEEQIISTPKTHNHGYKYDFTLSFAQSDKDLCRVIYDQLSKENFRIWISQDQDESSALTMDEKCKIIDESECFLACMSDAYKRNTLCRCEAFYAMRRDCKIIPLIVAYNYRPDGWLNQISHGKCAIDFMKLDFESAKIRLKCEVERQRKHSKSNAESVTISMVTPTQILTENEYPSQIDQWTSNHIRSFLTMKNLTAFLEMFSEMNGKLLHELYRMCLTNRESMFHTLKAEMCRLNSTNELLTLTDYLRFLHEIQKYAPSFKSTQK